MYISMLQFKHSSADFKNVTLEEPEAVVWFSFKYLYIISPKRRCVAATLARSPIYLWDFVFLWDSPCRRRCRYDRTV